MNSSSSPVTVTSADSPASRLATAGSPATSGLAATTVPSRSRTWLNESSSAWARPAATNEGGGAGSMGAAVSSARTRAALRTSSVSAWRMASTRAIPPPSRARPTRTVAATVVRTRTAPALARTSRSSDQRGRRPGDGPDPPSPAIFRHPIARSPDGLDRRPPERAVELVAQAPDVHLDDVGVAFEVDVPHVVQDLALGHDAARPAHQELEGRQLPRRQLALP